MTALFRAPTHVPVSRGVEAVHSLWIDSRDPPVQPRWWDASSVRAPRAEGFADAPPAGHVLAMGASVPWIVPALIVVTAVSSAAAVGFLARRLVVWARVRGGQRRAAEIFGRVDSFAVTAEPSGESPDLESAERGGRGSAAALNHRSRAARAALGASRPRRRLLALAAGLLVGAALGGSTGLVVGACVTYLVWRWAGAQSRAEELRGARERRAAAGQLPLTAELLAACMAAGSGPADAARAVGACLGGPLGERLVRACEELRLGAEPAAAWSHVAELPGGGPLARCLVRAQLSGAPAVEQIARQAVEARAARSRLATARARKAAVLVTGPLGLCFLPAFLLAGVVPVIVGLGRTLL